MPAWLYFELYFMGAKKYYIMYYMGGRAGVNNMIYYMGPGIYTI